MARKATPGREGPGDGRPAALTPGPGAGPPLTAPGCDVQPIQCWSPPTPLPSLGTRDLTPSQDLHISQWFVQGFSPVNCHILLYDIDTIHNTVYFL